MNTCSICFYCIDYLFIMIKNIKKLLVYIIVYVCGIKVDKKEEPGPIGYLVKYDICDQAVLRFLTDKNIKMRHMILQTNIYNWAIYKVYNYPLFTIVSILKDGIEHYIIKDVSFNEYNYNSQFQIVILYYNNINIDKIIK